MYLDKSQSGTGWSFDLDSYTLTLDGFNAQGLEINNISRVLTIVPTGLEGAVIVGKDGQALQITGVDGYAQLCDGAGNVSAYVKITASGSNTPYYVCSPRMICRIAGK